MAKDWGTQFDPVVKTLYRTPPKGSYPEQCPYCKTMFQKGETVVQYKSLYGTKKRYHLQCFRNRR